MAIKIAGTEVISDDKRILNNESLPDIRPSLLLDFANSKTLDPRITFTRGSTATYWDGKTTAKAEENLTPKSQEFHNWSLNNGTVTADSTTAPDGTTTADTFTATAANAKISLTRTYGDGGDATFSVWIKRKTGTGNVEISHAIFGSSTVVSVTSDWQRFEVTTALSSANRSYGIKLASSGDEIYLWGAQLEQRSSATAYTPTTSSPIVKYQPVLQTAASGEARFDHDPVTGESKGLLIEEARTNLFDYSEDLSSLSSVEDKAIIVSDTIVAPDGTLTGSKIKENLQTGVHQFKINTSVTNGTNYTFSFYAKAGEITTVGLRFTASNSGFTFSAVLFDLSDGTVNVNPTGNASIEYVGNGWYRCSDTSTATATTSGAQLNMYISNGQGDGYSGSYFWGVQLEEGSFPTSYIPTSGSTVTRAQDVASLTGSNFSDWYTQGGNTVYVDFERITDISPTVYERIFTLSDGSASNRLYLYYEPNTSTGYTTLYNNGVRYSDYNLITFGTGNVKTSTSFDYNSLFTYVNGSSNTEDTSLIIPEFSKLNIGSSVSNTTSINSTIKKIAFYPKRLPNATLQAMTEE